ncbi:MAG: hypothetical protein DRI44_09140 [Chlamydiae bacterium]|nr:MAG: hypothetical protein DRI44_09140 [Chlamydiota bacterium]
MGKSDMGNRQRPIMATVILPVFNKLKHLPYVLLTLERNFWTCSFNWELLIIDGGSTDKTREYILDYMTATHLKISYVRFDWGGWVNPSLPRNYGTVLARGDILIYIDGDHVVNNNFINGAIEPFFVDDDQMVVRAMVYDSTTGGIPGPQANAIIQKLILQGEYNALKWYENLRIPVKNNRDKEMWSYAVKKEKIYQIGGHDMDFLGGWGRDEDWVMHALKHIGCRFNYSRSKDMSVIHLWHPKGGPNGVRDASKNHKVLEAKLKNIDKVIEHNKIRLVEIEQQAKFIKVARNW